MKVRKKYPLIEGLVAIDRKTTISLAERFPTSEPSHGEPRRRISSSSISCLRRKWMIATRIDIEAIKSGTPPTRTFINKIGIACSTTIPYARSTRVFRCVAAFSAAIVICPSYRGERTDGRTDGPAAVDVKPEVNYVLRYKSAGHTPFASRTGYYRRCHFNSLPRSRSAVLPPPPFSRGHDRPTFYVYDVVCGCL